MSKHDFLVYFPESPEVQAGSLTLKDSFYAVRALGDCAAKFGLKVQNDTRLIAPPNLASDPETELYERTRQWLKNNTDSLDDYVLQRVDLLKRTRLFQNYDEQAEIIHLLLITDEVLENLDEPGDLVGLAKSWEKRRSAAMDALVNMKSPSTVVGSPEAIQTAAKFLIYGRPVEAQGIQPALYNRTIAQLVYDLENLDTIYPHPSAEHLAKCIKFMEISNKFYTGENAEKMRLEDLRACHVFEDHDENIKVERVVQGARLLFVENDCVYSILEGKNEFGLYGDPLLQAMVSYAKANQDKKNLLKRTHLPAILIGLAGNVLTIGVVIFTDAVYVDTLLTMNLLFGHLPDQKILRFARVASVVATAKAGLCQYYANLPDHLDFTRHPSFPDPTPVEGVLPTLRYTGKFDKFTGQVWDALDKKLRSSTVFTAELVDSHQKVVVKFTPVYCPEAHNLLADNKLEPNLHVCTKLKGGLWMVVMDWIKGERVLEMLERELQIVERDVKPMEIYVQAKKAVELLHQKDLVFGDLRLGNIFYNTDGLFQLVDFDMAGRHGIACYPATLYRRDSWPLSMTPGAPLLKEHDLEWLTILKRIIEG